MAKMPGWIKVHRTYVPSDDGADHMHIEVSINWWHPGAWWKLFRAVIELIYSRLVSRT